MNKKNSDDIEKIEDFFAPPVPPPRKKASLATESKALSKEVLEMVEEIESKDSKAVLIKCERCDKEHLITIPKDLVLIKKATELLITYVHKDSKKKKKNVHCLIFEIDKDFHVQLPKSSDVIFSSQKWDKNFKKLEKKDVYIHCKKCGETITIPVPKYMILESNIPKTPIVFIHNNKYGLNQHAIIAYLDNNFGDRATRVVDILIIDLFMKEI